MGPSGGPLGNYAEFGNYLSYINLMTVGSFLPPPLWIILIKSSFCSTTSRSSQSHTYHGPSLTFELHSGSWSATTGPNSPLATCGADTSVIAAVATWTAGGFPANKILLFVSSLSFPSSYRPLIPRTVESQRTDTRSRLRALPSRTRRSTGSSHSCTNKRARRLPKVTRRIQSGQRDMTVVGTMVLVEDTVGTGSTTTSSRVE